MHFCGEMPDNSSGKWATEKKAIRFFPSNLMLLANQDDNTKNVHVVKNMDLWTAVFESCGFSAQHRLPVSSWLSDPDVGVAFDVTWISAHTVDQQGSGNVWHLLSGNYMENCTSHDSSWNQTYCILIPCQNLHYPQSNVFWIYTRWIITCWVHKMSTSTKA